MPNTPTPDATNIYRNAMIVEVTEAVDALNAALEAAASVGNPLGIVSGLEKAKQISESIQGSLRGKPSEIIQETELHHRDSWYEKGDYICLIDDEGRDNQGSLRKAQIIALKSEFEGLATIYTPDEHHDGEPGPYVWRIRMWSPSEIQRVKDIPDGEYEDNVTAIGEAGGYDSTGFGYHFILRDDGNVYTTEMFGEGEPLGNTNETTDA